MRSQARAEAAPSQSLQRRSRKSASARETQEEMEAGSCSGSTNQCTALAKNPDRSYFSCSGFRLGDQFSGIFLSSIINDYLRFTQGNRNSDSCYGCSSRKEHRRLTVRKPERRRRERLLRRRRPGRDSDALIQDRRFEGHLAHIDTEVSEQTRESLRDRKAAWRSKHS